MTVITYDHQKSDGLEKELVHIKNDFQKIIRSYQAMTVQEFIDDYFKWKTGSELADSAKRLTPGSFILDIGAGFGHSSVYYIKNGHRVTAVEPSPEACACIETMVQKIGGDIEIHACAMEKFDTGKRYDACIFNASLHHCDEPLLALKKCHAFLKPGGRVFLINEQVLKFFRSKKWWLWMLENKPDKIGHYGGNEHIYRYREYIDMVSSAGFEVVEKVPIYYRDPRSALATFLLSKGNHGAYCYSDKRVVSRYIWYSLVSRMIGNPAFFRLCKTLSLITTTMIGKKALVP